MQFFNQAAGSVKSCAQVPAIFASCRRYFTDSTTPVATPNSVTRKSMQRSSLSQNCSRPVDTLALWLWHQCQQRVTSKERTLKHPTKRFLLIRFQIYTKSYTSHVRLANHTQASSCKDHPRSGQQRKTQGSSQSTAPRYNST